MKITIDTGVKEYEINGNGVLRFNPSDPNLYKRFMSLSSDVGVMEEEVKNADETNALDIMEKYDRRIKEKLSYVFGTGNDFDKLLGGVNVMAVSGTGELVITNVLNALRPLIEDGIKEYAKATAAKAVRDAE